ncbi:MAG: hypothetical protein QW802_04135 [Candidatus Altiarchaeota archaeon]
MNTLKNKFGSILRFMLVSVFLFFFLETLAKEEIFFEVKTDKEVYYPNEKITIFANIKNFEKNEKFLVLEFSITPSKPRVQYPVTLFRVPCPLKAEEEKIMNISSLVVSDTMPSDSYNLTASLLYEGKILAKAETSFKVEKTLNVIDLKILTCKDEKCDYQRSIFHKGDTLYIGYSSVEGALVKANVKFPDGRNMDLILPSTLKLENPGRYSIKVAASKSGYKTIIKDFEIGVLEEEIKVLEEKLDREKELKIAAEKPKENLQYILILTLTLIIFLGIWKIYINKKVKGR